MVNGVKLTALIDSCSSDSFISEQVINNLNISIKPSTKKVTMALTSLESSIIGHCIFDIELNGVTYRTTRLDVMKNLCSDVILGYDFQRQHQNVTFKLVGKKSDLIVTTVPHCLVSVSHVCDEQSHKTINDPIYNSIPSTVHQVAPVNQFEKSPSLLSDNTIDNEVSYQEKLYCALATADIEEPALFGNLSKDAKPTATKSRRFNKDDRKFIETEICKLLEKGVIEPSTSPWRAQVVCLFVC